MLEKARKQLDEKEHTLECTRVVLQQTVQEKDLQRHLVEKHMETETKLGQQARKLLVVCDDTNRYRTGAKCQKSLRVLYRDIFKLISFSEFSDSIYPLSVMFLNCMGTENSCFRAGCEIQGGFSKACQVIFTGFRGASEKLFAASKV